MYQLRNISGSKRPGNRIIECQSSSCKNLLKNFQNQYITCYYGSMSYDGNRSACSWWKSWDGTGRPWAADSMTLYWWRKASLLLCTFLFSSNTVCILIFVGSISSECPVSEDFHNYMSWGILCPKALWHVWVTTVAITQQPEKYYKHLLSHLSHYCRFGETLLTPSRAVDMSMIYLRRYASTLPIAAGEDPSGRNASLQYTPLLHDCSTASPFSLTPQHEPLPHHRLMW